MWWGKVVWKRISGLSIIILECGVLFIKVICERTDLASHHLKWLHQSTYSVLSHLLREFSLESLFTLISRCYHSIIHLTPSGIYLDRPIENNLYKCQLGKVSTFYDSFFSHSYIVEILLSCMITSVRSLHLLLSSAWQSSRVLLEIRGQCG